MNVSLALCNGRHSTKGTRSQDLRGGFTESPHLVFQWVGNKGSGVQIPSHQEGDAAPIMIESRCSVLVDSYPLFFSAIRWDFGGLNDSESSLLLV